MKPAPEHIPDDEEKNTDEYKTFMADLHTTTERLVNINDEIPSETMMPLKNMGDDTLLINFICTNLPFSVRDKIKLLQINDISQRLVELLKLENRDIQLNELKNQIRQKTHEDLDEQQKEYFPDEEYPRRARL